MDRSIMSRSGSLLDRPILRTRLVADMGCSSTGGAAQVGRVGLIVAMRSWTSWRASRRSVPCSNSSTIWESCSTDFERISATPGTPLSDCSRGTVISDSTSVGASPIATVWISTFGGANSGNTSTGASLTRCTPMNTRADASATMMKRNFRLDPTIHRMEIDLSVCSGQDYRSVTDGELDAVNLGDPDGDDLGALRGAVRQDRPAALLPAHLDLVPDVHRGARGSCTPTRRLPCRRRPRTSGPPGAVRSPSQASCRCRAAPRRPRSGSPGSARCRRCGRLVPGSFSMTYASDTAPAHPESRPAVASRIAGTAARLRCMTSP